MRGGKARGQMRREILNTFHVAIRCSRCLAVDGGVRCVSAHKFVTLMGT